MIGRHLVLGLSFLFAIQACNDSVPQATSQLKINEGSLVEAGDPVSLSTVLITTRLSNCTGVLISPTRVLTAAHCKPQAGVSRVFFYSGSEPLTESGAIVTSVKVPNGVVAESNLFISNKLFADLAILTLDRAAPATHESVELFQGQLQANTEVLAVGTGRHTVGVARTMQKRTAAVAQDNATTATVLLRGSVTNPGDSGGPIFVTEPGSGELQLVGVLHGREGHPLFFSVTKYTRVASHLDFILNN